MRTLRDVETMIRRLDVWSTAITSDIAELRILMLEIAELLPGEAGARLVRKLQDRIIKGVKTSA